MMVSRLSVTTGPGRSVQTAKSKPGRPRDRRSKPKISLTMPVPSAPLPSCTYAATFWKG